jgi:hypothetical protein
MIFHANISYSSYEKLRNETLTYAKNCSWKAGPLLVQKMQKNTFSA